MVDSVLHFLHLCVNFSFLLPNSSLDCLMRLSNASVDFSIAEF